MYAGKEQDVLLLNPPDNVIIYYLLNDIFGLKRALHDILFFPKYIENI